MKRSSYWPAVVRGFLLVGALVLGTLVLAATPALAHDDLVDASPAPGAPMDTAVGQVRLTFSGELAPDLVQVRVRDANGRDHTKGSPAVLGGEVGIRLRPLDVPGRYEVAYRVVGADGHPVTGSYGFRVTAVGARAAAPAGEARGTDSAPPAGASAGGESSTDTSVAAGPAPAAERGAPVGPVAARTWSTWLIWAVGVAALAALVGLISVVNRLETSRERG